MKLRLSSNCERWKRKIRRTLRVFGVMIPIVVLYLTDPVFMRSVAFKNYEVKYEWRIFSNFYCNWKTDGHCHTIYTNRFNAKMQLYLQLIENYNGQKEIKEKLVAVVKRSDRVYGNYQKMTYSTDIQIDTLIKYKDRVFMGIWLK